MEKEGFVNLYFGLNSKHEQISREPRTQKVRAFVISFYKIAKIVRVL